jgi:arylsulfatase A-like enzyme
VFFSADNGCSPAADIKNLREQGHDPCAGLRGTKADVYEGGHRVPTIVRWPGTVPPGSTRAVTVTLTDFMTTAAEIAGAKMPDGAAEDSVSFVPVLKGGTNAVHEAVIHHSINGSFAIRRGAWKLCACPGSGGWSDPKPGAAGTKKLPPVQLFNLEQDPAEQTNLQDRHPEIVRELSALLESYQREGRRR